jgi:hypothetical protein
MITLAIPNYNRCKLVIESFIDVLNCEIISEILIYDDFSDKEIYDCLVDELNKIKNKKIKIFRQDKNVGAFLNKKNCIESSSNEIIILLDSDNKLNEEYIKLIPQNIDINSILLPVRGICESNNLNYEKFSGLKIDKKKFIDLSLSNDTTTLCMLNTGNYVVNKSNYLMVINQEKNIDNPYGCDVFYFLYLWFKNNSKASCEVIENMKYFHRLHKKESEEKSFYLKTLDKSELFLKKLLQKINELNQFPT